jgi:hypothetical protein
VLEWVLNKKFTHFLIILKLSILQVYF